GAVVHGDGRDRGRARADGHHGSLDPRLRRHPHGRQPRDQCSRPLRLCARGAKPRHPRRLGDGHQRRSQSHAHRPGAGLAHGGASHQELEGDCELATCDAARARRDSIPALGALPSPLAGEGWGLGWLLACCRASAILACANMSASTWSLSFRISARFVTVATCTAMAKQSAAHFNSRKGDYGISGGPCGRHAGLRPANFHSLVHFATSSARNLPNSMGEVEKVLPPKSAYFALISCFCSPVLISPFSK